MIESKSIYITLVLIAFCICNGMGSPVADPDPNVKVKVNVDVNDNCGSPGGCSGGHEEHKPPCKHEKHEPSCKHWGYPSKDWPCTCSGFCNGTMQSPIDICTGSAQKETGSLIFSNSYNEAIDKITIKNNGHTVGASWAADLDARTISGGGLTGEYTLAQFHFHWGCKDYRGSEHVVDGTRYAMELHLVHFKSIYGNLSVAVQQPDGLAVLGIFFNVGTKNAALEPFTKKLSLVVTPSYTGTVIPFGKALIDFIPTTRTFYRYQGSLTTPTCNEVVTWSVFSSQLTFSDEQVKAFRMLEDKECHKMCDNYRGIQPLNGRVVEKYN